MEKFARYFAAFDGHAQWSQIRPLYEDVFHPACMFVTADGELDKQQWAETVKGLTSRGAIASEYEVAGKEDDTFLYKVTIAVGDHEPLHLTSKATVKDGQIIRVEPSDPAEFTTLAGRSRSIRRIE